MSSGWTPINLPLTTSSKANINSTVKITFKPVKTTVTNTLKPKRKMPPKVAAATAEGSSNTKAGKTEKAVDDELKLSKFIPCAPNSLEITMADIESLPAWALICQMSSGGKLVGVNWEEVKAQIEAPTKHAA